MYNVDMQAYISNIIKISKILKIKSYDEMRYSCKEVNYTSEITMEI